MQNSANAKSTISLAPSLELKYGRYMSTVHFHSASWLCMLHCVCVFVPNPLKLVNRPGVARAVLQSPLLLFLNWLILLFRVFKTRSIPERKSSGAETLREWSTSTICHMSRVTCQVSGFLFKASALWADAFYKSICPSVCLSVCVFVHFWGTV